MKSVAEQAPWELGVAEPEAGRSAPPGPRATPSQAGRKQSEGRVDRPEPRVGRLRPAGRPGFRRHPRLWSWFALRALTTVGPPQPNGLCTSSRPRHLENLASHQQRSEACPRPQHPRLCRSPSHYGTLISGWRATRCQVSRIEGRQGSTPEPRLPSAASHLHLPSEGTRKGNS